MSTVPQKIANAPLGSFGVHSDSIDANSGARAQYVKLDIGGAGLSSPVTALNPLPVAATISVAGLATEAKQDTQIAAQATAARQDTGNTSLSSVDTKLTSQATGTKQDAQTTLLTTISGNTTATPAATLTDVYLALKYLANCILRPSWLDPATRRPNIATVTTVTTCTTVTTLTTCATVTSLSQFGGVAVRDCFISPVARSNWAQNVRGNIA